MLYIFYALLLNTIKHTPSSPTLLHHHATTMADRKPEENGVSGKPKQLMIADFDPPKPAKRNKYAFACAMLASMTSILLGYGN